MRRSHLAAALSIGAAGLIWHTCSRYATPDREGLSPGHLALAAALEGQRPVEPRLAGGFGYAPCSTLPSSGPSSGLIPDRVCSGLPAGTPARKALARAAQLIQSEAEAGPSPPALHAAGILALVQGKGDAVGRLQRAVALAPHDARIWSDLAAAYLVRAERMDEPRDLVRALAAADHAVRLNGVLKEARFNRALAYEALYLPAARERWQEVLDTEGPWRDEARRRQDALRSSPRIFGGRERSRLARAAGRGSSRNVDAVVGMFREESREHVEEELLGAWAEQPGRRGPDAPLSVARAVGEALVRIGGDALLRDTVAAIDAAVGKGDGERLDALARGHRAFDRGMKLYRTGEYERGAPELAAARKSLEEGGSPFAARAAFWEACSIHRLGRSAEAAAVFARLDREPGASYGSLLGHAAWMAGNLRVEENDPAGGLLHLERALARFERIGEEGSAAGVRNLMTWPLHQLGRRREAWADAYQVLRRAREHAHPRRRNRPYMTAADIALADGYLEAALALQDEAVRQSTSAGSEEVLVDALIWQGLMRDRAGRGAEALEDVRLARKRLRRMPDPAARRRLEADLSRIDGEISLASNPRRAEALLTSALDVYRDTRNDLLSVWVLRLRARAFREMGELDRAEADLREALAAYERLGKGELDQRLAAYARTEEAFDEMIAFQALDRKRPEAAFHYADWARTRVLPGGATRIPEAGLDKSGRRQLLAAEARPLGLDEIRRRLPPRTSLIQYAVLPDRLLIWRVWRGGVLLREVAVSADGLQGRVARLRAAAGSEDAWLRESSALFELLVRPWRQGIARGETVVLVPDKSLHAVPFAALQEPGTGRFLIQDLRLALAPSATLAVNGPAAGEDGPSSAGRFSALVVGDPAFNRLEWNGLASLSGARAEAARVARAVPGSVVLRGEDATRDSFFDLARRSDRIHFAGHALADSVDPLRSLLLLAPSGPADPGALYAWEVYREDLAGTRLVVLSSCGTADASIAPEEGVTSLARAFLAAGVPRVVASLWNVDDGAAGRLFAAFYSDPRALSDPVDALRYAQLSLLDGTGDGSAPWDWGAFEIIATQLYR